MSKKIENPLSAGELEGAAWLCLNSAATTDTSHPLGLGSAEYTRREHHARRHRFEEAKKKVESGITSLLELGITAEDCAWAAEYFGRATDTGGWFDHFKAAEQALKRDKPAPAPAE